jgi:hypothetical protein
MLLDARHVAHVLSRYEAHVSMLSRYPSPPAQASLAPRMRHSTQRLQPGPASVSLLSFSLQAPQFQLLLFLSPTHSCSASLSLSLA